MAGVSDNPRDGLDDTVPADDHTQPSQPASERRSSPTVPPPPGEQRYQLGAELGRGGMGRVVEAFDVQLGRTVALKEVLPKAASASSRRFAREVALTAKLEHPSIVPLYDAGTTPDGRPYYVMRRVSGRPLDELMARSRKLEDRLALLPAVQSAIDAVAHAHRRGVIHRDLKPANILVGDLGETIVIDWGLAKVIGEDDEPATRDSLPSDSLQTQMGSVFGTPGFMAPEQARGDEMGTHGDVYALGATLYQLLAGTPPHAGNSATAVIEKTLKHHMIPLAEIAPGAPAELVTIVNKALAAEPSQRYPHAGALGEDLRRFLTGQLVAAHRYTAWQRLGRFARRHRAALAVAVLAAIALAVLATISVRRIVHERDVANAARAEAIAGRQAAEKANRELAERHDALLVSRARARLDLNPTEALATLKLLPAGSTQLDEARAVAQAAVMRGVTWAIRSTLEPTIMAELSFDSRRLLQVTRDGRLRIWDLQRRRLEHERQFTQFARALWITGDKLLVTHSQAPAAILDPETNTLETTTLPPASYAEASAAGDRIVFQSSAGAGMFDVATRTVTMLATEPVTDVAISPDGAVLAFTTKRETVVVDRAGTRIATLAPATRLEFSSAGFVAALVGDKVLELELGAAKRRFVEIVPPENHRAPIDLLYRGRELLVMTAHVTFWAWDGKRASIRGRMPTINAGMRLADEDCVILSSSDNKIHLIEERPRAAIQLPANLTGTRLVARPDSSLVVVVAAGIILGVDLDVLRPRTIRTAPDTRAEFVGDDMLIASRSVDRGWEWIDLRSGERTRIALDTWGVVAGLDIDAGGRVLLYELGPPPGVRVYSLQAGSPTARLVVEGKDAWARLVPGNAIIYTAGDPRVMAVVGDGPPREVVKMRGFPDGGVAIGHLRAAIHSTEGELVRVDLATGAVDRTAVPLGTSFLIDADEVTGKVVVAEDHRVLMWDGAVTQIASFDEPVGMLAMLQGGIVAAVLRDNETFLVDLAPNRQPVRVFPPGRARPHSSPDGRLFVSVGNAEQLDILELPQRTRWTLPRYYEDLSGGGIVVSPGKRRVLQHTLHALVLWELPLAPARDFASWLDEQTNATVDAGGELLWPWQLPNPK